MGSGDLQKYLLKHTAPVVATSQNYFLLDHHHLLAALWKANIPDDDKRAYLNVTRIITAQTDDELLADMLRHNETYSVYNDINLPPNLIPPSLQYLLNDVWRGLVYFVR